jgi:two-component system KDP operon response regulator KdpE
MQDNTPVILVVEDDRDIRNLMSAVLQKNGYLCSTASTSIEALHRFTDDIQLVVTDLNLPGDGVALIKSLRQIREVPLVIVTGFHRQYADRLDALGHITWLTKPIEFTSLLNIVKLELERSAKRMVLAGR